MRQLRHEDLKESNKLFRVTEYTCRVRGHILGGWPGFLLTDPLGCPLYLHHRITLGTVLM